MAASGGGGTLRETQEEAGESQGVLDPEWKPLEEAASADKFPDGRNMGCKRRGLVENNSDVFNLSNCKKRRCHWPRPWERRE